jgi:hypothetical protein
MNDDLTQTIANNMTHFAHSALFILCKLCAILLSFPSSSSLSLSLSLSFSRFYKLLYNPAKGPHSFHNFMQFLGGPHTKVKWGWGAYCIVLYFFVPSLWLALYVLCQHINPLAPELFLNFLHTLYLKCE